jgi:nucleotide-binding universal stress UspA family protein
MKKILVPVDFSNHTDISCTYALSIAKITGAAITLFHSFFDQVYFSDGGFTTGFETGVMLTDEIVIDFYKQKENHLRDLANRMKARFEKENNKDITVDYLIESGDPQVQILSAIQKINPDLIIMGSGGIGKKRFLTGSVSKKTMDHTDVPVVALPEIKQFLGMKNILYMTGLDKSDADILTKIFHLFQDFEPYVHCLHLNLSHQDNEAENLMKALSANKKLERFMDSCAFSVIDSRDVSRTLHEFARDNNIHMIAFIPHRHNIFRKMFSQDLTKKDLFMTNIPIMALQ